MWNWLEKIVWDVAILEFDFETIDINELRDINEGIIKEAWDILFRNGIDFAWTHDISRLLLHIPESRKKLVNTLLSEVKKKTNSTRIEESLTHKREIYVWSKKEEFVKLFRDIEIN